MSSWLNLNESLSSLKGQISNFANNVLTDEEGTDVNTSQLEELKNTCARQELEIQNLRKINDELKGSNNVTQNGEASANNWDWECVQQNNVETKSEDTVSDVKQLVKKLENEKNDLVEQLEQLDLENQQNIGKLVNIREKLQDENNELKEKFLQLKQQNKNIIAREEKTKKELKELQLRLEQSQNNISVSEDKSRDEWKGKYELILKENQKLKAEIEESHKELSVLKSTNSTLHKVLEDTKSGEDELLNAYEKIRRLEGENKIIYIELSKAKEAINQFDIKNIEDAENAQKISFILERYEKQVSSLKEELEETRRKQTASKFENEELKNLREDFKIAVKEKQDLHTKYINIITENVKKYVECDNICDFQDCELDDPLELDFSKQVQNIMKILLDLKCKCESLEKDIYEISQEKTNILTEKNHEIEKLLQNSEILSQEVITKSQTMKEYENECSELIKNNDLLITELEAYKNNSGLQTISESNEDNMLLLESQLENANKRIEDLQKIVDNLEKEKSYTEKQKDHSDDKILEHLSDAENEISIKKDYQVLLNSFDDLQIEYETLKNNLEFTSNENEELKISLEKFKTDFENTDYQLSEINISMDSIKEELELYKKKVNVLLEENEKLQMRNIKAETENKNIRCELNDLTEKLLEEEETKKKLELQIRNSTEKLQHYKMAETSLKLQNDTLNKELLNMSEVKNNFESLLNEANDTITGHQNNCIDLQKKCETILMTSKTLEEQLSKKDQEIIQFKDQITILEEKLEKARKDCTETKGDVEKTEAVNQIEPLQEDESENKVNQEETLLELNTAINDKNKLKEELQKLQSGYSESIERTTVLEQQLQELTASRNELINMVTTKHQENVAYHNEIQRLSQIIQSETEKSANLQSVLNNMISNEELLRKNEEIEKLTDQNNFLKEKCEVMAKNLLEVQAKLHHVLAENSGPSEKEQALIKKLERLQSHLIEVEEHYTQELLQAEQKNTELQTKVNEIEQREKNSSTMYTSVSIRANQQVEVLQNQLQMVTNQREELRKKISDSEDLNNKQAAALANLQFVLEQFQKDKEKDVMKETERIRRQITSEKQVQEDLKKQIFDLKLQLGESKQGLQAASRLSDQLESSKKYISTLKEEVYQLQESLSKSEEKLKNISSQTDGKVDKSLIKNLVIGFVSSNNNLTKDQLQILKIIATVLDFNQQDHDKVNLNKPPQGSWLGSFLAPQSNPQNISQESLSQAFVKFLENESKPRVIPSLLSANGANVTKSGEGSKTNTPRQSPIVLSEIVLPTFADFAQNRNSSSILKDVLKDNNT